MYSLVNDSKKFCFILLLHVASALLVPYLIFWWTSSRSWVLASSPFGPLGSAMRLLHMLRVLRLWVQMIDTFVVHLSPLRQPDDAHRKALEALVHEVSRFDILQVLAIMKFHGKELDLALGPV